MKNNQTKTVEIIHVDDCPKCHSNIVLHSDWVEDGGQIVHITNSCQKCHYFWREKVDITI